MGLGILIYLFIHENYQVGGAFYFFYGPSYHKKMERYERKKNLKNNFEKDESFNYFSSNSFMPLDEERIHFPIEPLLSVVVGQSGIGKSTEICEYAKTLRKNKNPVRYINMKENIPFSFEQFLRETFGTDDMAQIIQIIIENYTKKNVVPTLIIDNIHRCLDPKGKIHGTLIDFLNTTCFQQLQMAVIMLTSVNAAAYEIENRI